MWCGNGHETTCHCGWKRDSREEARPRASRIPHFTFSRSSSLFCSVTWRHLTFSSQIHIEIVFLFFSVAFLPALSIWRVDTSKECPVQAKPILWLFFERVYFVPHHIIKWCSNHLGGRTSVFLLDVIMQQIIFTVGLLKRALIFVISPFAWISLWTAWLMFTHHIGRMILHSRYNGEHVHVRMSKRTTLHLLNVIPDLPIWVLSLNGKEIHKIMPVQSHPYRRALWNFTETID